MKLLAGISFLVSAGLAHWLTLESLPGAIMARAMDTMAERGIPFHSFVLVPRATPQNQTVVRPSPDLAYSICRFDLTEAPYGLEVIAGPSVGLASMSFFDAETNNFATLALAEDQSLAVELLPTSLQPQGIREEPESTVVRAPTETGLILLRRLAPTTGRFAEVEAASTLDRCAPIEAMEPGSAGQGE